MAFNKGYVKEKMEGFRRFTPLLRELVVRDIKVRYRHSALGLVWTVLNPLLMMVVITIVFSTLFKQNIPNFPIYYLSGSLIFAFNSESTTTALNSIISNASLIKASFFSTSGKRFCAFSVGFFLRFSSKRLYFPSSCRSTSFKIGSFFSNSLLPYRYSISLS